jgi:hypothetical protein
MTSPAIAKDPAKASRLPIPERKQNALDKPDFDKLLEDWKPQTGILKQLKNVNAEQGVYIKITPDIAKDLLKLNEAGRNRRRKWWKIELYTKTMLNKRWKDKNGETIKISKTWKLLDGQHRLWAIVLSKVTVELLIVTGLDDNAFAYIDLGSNRDAADITSINGYQHYDSKLAYAIKCILLYEKSSLFKGGITSKEIANYEIQEWQEDTQRMERLVDDLDIIVNTWLPKNKNFFTAPQWLAIYYILRTLPGRAKDAKEFLEQFIEGNDLKRTSPIKVVRGYFENGIENLYKHKKRNRVNRNILTLKVKYLFAAWDLWLEGATVSEVKIDHDNLEVKRPAFIKRKIAA